MSLDERNTPILLNAKSSRVSCHKACGGFDMGQVGEKITHRIDGRNCERSWQSRGASQNVRNKAEAQDRI